MTPAWLDRAEYPFASRWIEIDGARMHYGQAEVVAWPEVGHAPQEERGPESAALVARFLDDIVGRRTA